MPANAYLHPLPSWLPASRALRAPLIRVTYVLNQYPKVSHTFIRREILALRELGADVSVIAMRGWCETPLDAEDLAEQCRTRYVLQRGAGRLVRSAISLLLRRRRGTLRALTTAMSMMRGSHRAPWYHLVYWAEATLVAHWVLEEGSQHIHAHFGTNASEVAMLASMMTGVPFSFTAHGPEEFDAPAALGLQTKIRHARFVVAISSYARSQLFRLVPFEDWSRIKLVHCGVDGEFFRVTDLHGLASSRFVCIGRLCEQKGQAVLLRALRLVLDRGHRCSLVLAGDGELRPQLEAEIERLGLHDAVTITGWIPSGQVLKELVASRYLVLPSFAEGLPVVLMESLAAGRPAITTYVAGIPELVRQGREGWLVPAGDVEALAGAMIEALRTPVPTLLSMAQSCRARARQRHFAPEQAARLLDYFDGSRARVA